MIDVPLNERVFAERAGAVVEPIVDDAASFPVGLH